MLPIKRADERDRLRLTRACRSALHDYVAAIVSRRAKRQLSRRVRRAVTCSQVGLLLIMAAALLLVVGGRRRAPFTPGAAALHAWSTANTVDAELLHTTSLPRLPGGDQPIRARYRETTKSRRTVEIKRLFIVRGERVVRVEDDW